MRVRTKILNVAAAGAMLLSAAPAYAADPAEFMDEIPGEIVISRISPDKGEMLVTYNDTGTDVDSPIRVTLSWPNEGVETPSVESVGVGTPYFMTVYYNETVFVPGKPTFVSGVTETISDEISSGGAKLASNTSGYIYYGVTVSGAAGARQILGRVDYRDCMKAYETGVECIANEEGVFEPWLDGVKLEIPADPENPENPADPEDPTEPEDPEEPEEPETPEEPEKNGGGDGASDSGGASNSTSDLSGSGNSGGSGTGRNFAIAALTPLVESGYGNYGGYSGDAETTEESSESGGETTGGGGGVKSVMTTGKVATPTLGGGEEETPRDLKWWALIPAGIAAVGLLAWWIVPIFKKKSKKVEKNS